MGGKSSAPPTPDYVGAAQQTAAGNLEAAQAAAMANRVNQVTPWGNLTYTTTNPGADPGSKDTQWTATTSLSPEQQSTLNINNQLNNQYAGLAQQGVNAIEPLLSNPNIDTSKLPQMPQNAGTTSQDVIMSRLQPQIDRDNAQLDAQLANQGVMPGSQAYTTAKQLLGQQHNDLLSQAAGQGVGLDMNASAQALQQQAFLTNQPLNIVNAMRTGAQVQAPTFQQVPQQQTTAGPDYSGAAQQTYNTNLANTNANNAQSAGLFGGLAGSALGIAGLGTGPGATLGGTAIAGLFSDRRLKTCIKPVGVFAGLMLYGYKYLWDNVQHYGVLAQEIEKLVPEAVRIDVTGFKRIDMGVLNGS